MINGHRGSHIVIRSAYLCRTLRPRAPPTHRAGTDLEEVAERAGGQQLGRSRVSSRDASCAKPATGSPDQIGASQPARTGTHLLRWPNVQAGTRLGRRSVNDLRWKVGVLLLLFLFGLFTKEAQVTGDSALFFHDPFAFHVFPVLLQARGL